MKRTVLSCVIALVSVLMLTGCSLAIPGSVGMADKAASDTETANARILKNIGAMCINNNELKVGTYDSLSDSPALAKYLDGQWPKLKDGVTPMQLIITEKDGIYDVITNATCDMPASSR